MIHPYARAALLLECVIAAFVTTSAVSIAGLWLGTAAAAVFAGVARQSAVFYLAVILPMSLALMLIHWVAASSQTTISDLVLSGPSSVFVTAGRIAIVGMAVQAAMLPLMAHDLLEDALWRLGLRGTPLALASASVNAVRDLTTFAGICIAALKARGLAPSIFSVMVELPHILVSVFAHALRSSLLREETWTHRSIDPELAVGLSKARWQPAQSSLALAFGTAAMLTIVLTTIPEHLVP
jgi:hypothetical protein